MRILHIITALGYGGAERLLVNLANYQANNHEVAIIYLKDEPKLASQLSQKVLLKKVPLGFTCIKQLRQEIEAFAPDVINSHLGHADLLTWLATQDLKIGKVSTLHLVRFKWDWRDVIYAQLYRAILKSVATDVWFTAVSTEFSQSAIVDFAIAPERMRVIYNSVPELNYLIDREEFRKKFQIESDFLNLLFVGRLHPVKGIEVLLKAVSQAKAQGKRLRLRIAGEGAIKSELETQVQDLNLNNEVSFLGAVNNPAEWMAASDALILPSYDEGLPTVLVEAYRAGLPVIASNIPGVRDVIIEGETGQVFEVGNAESLARVLIGFNFADPKIQGQIAAGYQKWKSDFYLPACAGALEKYYLTAIDYQKV